MVLNMQIFSDTRALGFGGGLHQLSECRFQQAVPDSSLLAAAVNTKTLSCLCIDCHQKDFKSWGFISIY